MKGTVEPERWIDRMVGAAVAMFIFALALSFTVNVVVRALPVIVGVVVTIAVLMIGIVAYRRWRDGW